jgi:hypothetical protein
MVILTNHVGPMLLVAAIAIGLTIRVVPLVLTGKHIFRRH